MKFLLRLLCAGMLVNPALAASNDELRAMENAADDIISGRNEAKDKTDAGFDFNPLVKSGLTITNPYAGAAEQPFTIAAPTPAPAPAASRVTCGGRTWTDGEYLGSTGDGKRVHVKLNENRIYLNWEGQIASNIYILFHLQERTFPINDANDRLIFECVNPMDPSTAPTKLLGKTSDGKITCNGYVMENLEWLGTFVDNGSQTIQYTKYVDGLLRVMIKQGINDDRTTNYNTSLMQETIYEQHGSFMNPKWRGVMSLDMFNGCYWNTVPKPATPLNDNNCQSGPALQGTTNVSQTGLRFSFTGSNIGTVKWRIKLGSLTVRENTTGPLNGNTTVDITYNSLGYGDYTLEIEGASCTSNVSSRAFSIEAPSTPNCQNGPSVNNLRNVSPTSMTVDFGGSNLHIFSWRIMQNTNVMASGRTNYIGNNTTDLGYTYLRNGSYTIEITAEDCKASAPATRTFSLDAPDTRPGCDRGPSLERVITANSTSLEFLFDGNNIFAIDWKITQNGNVMRQNRVAPQSNRPVISYATLPTGVYNIEIDGGNCKSTISSAKFGVDVPLPIYIANFKGDVVEKGVELTWEVVAEQDGKEFEVLRFDANMKNEQVLATVPLTDQRTGLYRFIDEKPLLGMSYYQLKQIDADGSFMKSKIVAVNPIALTGQLVAPNPAREYMDVQFSSRVAGETEVKIYTVSGVQISTSKIKIMEGKNVHRVNVQNLITGTYLMRIAHGGEESTLRFLKVD